MKNEASHLDEDEDEEKLQKSWPDLPLELASLILSHLYHKDYLSFRATCKSWSSVTPFHKQPLCDPDYPYYRFPYLLVLRRDQYNLFNHIHNTYQMSIQKLSSNKILCSNYGWLLMGELLVPPTQTSFFFNPFTQVRIDLPDLPQMMMSFTNFSFSSVPTSPDCVVVGVRIQVGSAQFCMIKPGEKNWTVVDSYDIIRSGKFRISDCSPLFHNGECFCLDANGKVGIFDPKDPKATWKICAKPFSRRQKICQSFMVESDGEFLAIAVSGRGGHVQVYKLDSCKTGWVSVSDLGDKVVYVSRSGSWADTTMFRGMGNKIYFPKLQNTHSVFYSLDTRKYHSYGDDFWSDTTYNIPESSYSTWVKPMLRKIA